MGHYVNNIIVDQSLQEEKQDQRREINFTIKSRRNI